MGRPRKVADQESTRERLLDAALVELGARGYDAMRLEDIARAVGITRPSLIHHYATKEALYRATVVRAFGGLAFVLRAAMVGEGRAVDDSFRARFFSIVDAFARFMGENDALARLIVRELVADLGEGRAILISHAVPLVDEIELFVSHAGRAALPYALPVRALVLMAVSDVLLRVSSGRALESELWGKGTETWDVVSAVLAQEPVPTRAVDARATASSKARVHTRKTSEKYTSKKR